MPAGRIIRRRRTGKNWFLMIDTCRLGVLFEDRLIAHYIKCRGIIKSFTYSYLPSLQSPPQPARGSFTIFTTRSHNPTANPSKRSSETLIIFPSSLSIGKPLSTQQAKAMPEIQSSYPVPAAGLLEWSRMQLQDHVEALPGRHRSALREGQQQPHQASQGFP